MSSQGNANKPNDIIHSALLLICVPLVFYGGYLLISKTAEEVPKPPDGGGGAKIPVIKYVAKLTRKGPPPGEAWLKQVDGLKAKMQSTQVGIEELDQKQHIVDSLDDIRQHVQDNMNDMPEEVSGATSLGRQLSHIANQIQKLADSKPVLPTLGNWQTQYEIARRKEKTEDQSRVAGNLRERLAALSRSHQAELADLTRRSRIVADELQRLRNKTDSIERSTRDAIAKEQRMQAFLRDKAEIDLLLQPFTTPAYVQLGSGYTDWRKVTEKQPISFSRLEASGSLDSNSINGVRSMLYIGSPHYAAKHHGARPVGSFPKDINSAANMEKVKRAQALIRKHSVYLIESGLLNP